jgi:hypothetical protein
LPQKEGPNVLYWVLAILGVCFVMFVGLFFAIAMFKGYKDAKTAASPVPTVTHHPWVGGRAAGGGYDDPADDDDDDDDDDDSIATGPSGGTPLPPVKRDIPHHDVKMLAGCSDADLHGIVEKIDDAVEIGAPRYNRGDFQGCYDTYAATAKAIEAELPKTCAGPIAALRAGRDKAAKLATSSERAWAMRDAFDGLIDVIQRKGTAL